MDPPFDRAPRDDRASKKRAASSGNRPRARQRGGRPRAAQVKDIFHERAWLQSAVDRVQIKFIIECTGTDHSQAIREAMFDEGIPILVWGKEVFRHGTATELANTTGGPAEPAPFE